MVFSRTRSFSFSATETRLATLGIWRAAVKDA
jgi:hypothetical protein